MALVCERAVNGAFVLESGQQELVDSQDSTVCREILILFYVSTWPIHGETQLWTNSAAGSRLIALLCV